MVSGACAILIALVAAGAEPDADAEVRAALSKGEYPWYDAKEDAAKPLMPPSELPDAPSGGGGFLLTLGQVIVFTLLVVLLAGLVALLAWAWHRYWPDPEGPSGRSRSSHVTTRTATLPSGLEVDLTDPLGEARRLRDQGDLAGAVICLFVHQLLTLDRLGLTRLAPGRTARQLVRAVQDRAVRGRVEPTLRLFEAVYYGHQVPTDEAFAAAWDEAEALERWVAEEARA